MILPSGMTVIGDGESTNMTGKATAYPAVGTAANSCTSIVLKGKSTTCKMFLIPCWHGWFTGVLCFIPLHLNILVVEIILQRNR
jgi:hypothetical protein